MVLDAVHRNEEPGSCSTQYRGFLYGWSVNSHLGLFRHIFAVSIFSIPVFKQLSTHVPSEQTCQQLLYHIKFLIAVYSGDVLSVCVETSGG